MPPASETERSLDSGEHFSPVKLTTCNMINKKDGDSDDELEVLHFLTGLDRVGANAVAVSDAGIETAAVPAPQVLRHKLVGVCQGWLRQRGVHRKRM